MAPMMSRADATVFLWKRRTRSALSSGTRPFMSSGSWEVTPVGHVFWLHFRLWMHPRANIMARALSTASAPRARVRTTPKPEKMRPDAKTRTCLRRPVPTRALCVSRRPSMRGMPMLLENSAGAAPVPPSPPSMVRKSGPVPVSSMAWQSARSSPGCPTQSLNPTGLPPESSRSFWAKRTASFGLLKAECRMGLLQSTPKGTPRASAISGVILPAGSMPPLAGLAPWESFTWIILTDSRPAVRAKRSGQKEPSSARHPK
mmetsp:Transcript_8919/g.30317  ORF Transcript_8919/g.30317 Transcript_8919/m.30317 type:complete len:259 (-) Transcript_8919:503-1279(-)